MGEVDREHRHPGRAGEVGFEDLLHARQAVAGDGGDPVIPHWPIVTTQVRRTSRNSISAPLAARSVSLAAVRVATAFRRIRLKRNWHRVWGAALGRVAARPGALVLLVVQDRRQAQLTRRGYRRLDLRAGLADDGHADPAIGLAWRMRMPITRPSCSREARRAYTAGLSA